MNNWKASFVQYFMQGTKKEMIPRLGVEMEHFIIDRVSQRAVPYSGEKGVKEILYRLMARYPDAQILPDDDFFGFAVPDFTVTLEPAAQLEISIAPMVSIRQITDVYRSFLQQLDSVLAPFGYAALSVGCHPTASVAELEQIPKKRYDLMSAHFQKTGTGGMEMMRGSASLQVSIDYSSQDDFRRKLQAAYYYGPVLKLLCDNAPLQPGEKPYTYLRRTDIWRRTDPARCGILPGVFSESYSFGDYADFLGHMPPIFLKRENAIQPTGFQAVERLFDGKILCEEEIAHLLSMAFPDVRVKQYLEIRFADSVPLPFLPAYCALVRGLLYSDKHLDYAQTQIQRGHLTEDDIRKTEDALMKYGWNAAVYGQPVSRLAKDFLKMAADALPEDEKLYLKAFDAVIRYGGIPMIPQEELRQLCDAI